jgi:small ubiquitin-related modifier
MADVKPDISNEPLTVKIRYNDASTVFRVKKDTLFSKVATAFCEKQGLDLKTVRFNVDGNRVEVTKTISAVGLEDGDIIDCMVMQVGGC